ncbi:PIN domain-containing protein [Oscillatoriales cyanobacterium USR001]|nr:PIN domain-containing protein [Oscillatoriales cyanobacterium USR001]
MSNQLHSISSYRFSQTDVLLFDTNVWLYIYGPMGEQYPRYRATYTLALIRSRAAKARILLDVLVLSEFINAYARFIYNQLPAATKPAEFKTFRKSADFQPIGEEIARQSEKVIERCELIESGFTRVNLREMIGDYAAGQCDFNDQILVELCKANELKLVTHDSDFKNADVTVITANPRYF